jgi:hypothetical protein
MSNFKFALNAVQATQFIEWSKTHSVSPCALGTQYQFSFTPTGLGDAVTVTNLITGEELNLTDYDSW